jgi:hypothetical protein
MRRINEMVADSLVGVGGDRQVAFFCECSDAACYRSVWLALESYEQARLHPFWAVLANGHTAAES